MSRRSESDAGSTLHSLVSRTDGLQPWRRVFHAATGLALVGVLLLLEPERGVTVAALSAVVGLQLGADLVRLRVPSMNRLFFRFFRPLASPREAGGIASSTWYVLGCALTIAAFPPGIVVSAILVLALADPAASWVGRVWGRRRFGSGTVEGSFVFVLVAFSVLATRHGIVVAAIASAVAAFLERTSWRLDDNLVTPVATGGALWVLEATVV